MTESTGDTARAAQAPPTSTLDDDDESKLCVICMEGKKDVLVMPCRHLCLCKACSSNTALTECPICRTAIVSTIAVFL